MTIDFPILYINLDRSTDRREKMEKQFAELGVKAVRIPGVDGVRDEGKHDYPKVSKFWSWVFNGRQLTRGEIGCAASHIKVARFMVEHSLNWALVFEDDINISSQELSRVAEVERLSRDFDLVSLMTSNPRGELFRTTLDDKPTTIHRVVGRRNLTTAQIYRRSGAQKLAAARRVFVPSDLFHVLESRLGLTAAFVWPNLFPIPADINASSVIDLLDKEAQVSPRIRYGSNPLWKLMVRPIVTACTRSRMRANNSRISGLDRLPVDRLIERR